LVLAVSAQGCSPAFSPPVRTSHDGAAGRLSPREVQVAGAGGLVQKGGSVWLAAPTLTNMKLELGADGSKWGFIMGWVGTRYTLSMREEGVFLGSGSAFDFESGIGAGMGGGNEDDVSGNDRAIGAYHGWGFAYHVGGSFAPWLRGRLQLSKAENAPETLWYSAMTGFEVGYGILHGYVGSGVAGYKNRSESFAGWNYLEGGLALHLDVDPRHAAEQPGR
jgi:hypothetical protein